jgi:hypothetical protein
VRPMEIGRGTLRRISLFRSAASEKNTPATWLRNGIIFCACLVSVLATQTVANAQPVSEADRAKSSVAASSGQWESVAVPGGCSSFPPTPCGEVQNNTSRTLRVSKNWTCSGSSAPLGTSCAQSITSVGAGSHIGGGNVDIDAYEIPANCRAEGYVNSRYFYDYEGWYKISSLETATINQIWCIGR